MEQSDYIENKSGHLATEDLMEAEDAAYHKSKEGLASGGRVPMFKGAMVPELDARAKINAALRAYKKYRRGEKNPRLKFKTFFEIYAGENFASGGLAGQLHLNQGGEAMPDPDYGPHTQTIDDDWYLNKYEKFLDGYLKSQEGSSTPLSQQDVNIMSSFFNNQN